VSTGSRAIVKAVSPRSGGEADKFGNRYEGRWTVGKLLEVLAGRAQSIVLEERGEGGVGVEFTVVRKNGQEESHQLKRQRGSSNSWSLRNLAKEGVLDSAARQVGMGRRFFFVSLLPCRALNELADQARRSDDLQVFIGGLTKTQIPDFNYLASQWGSPREAFNILQHVDVRWPDERHITDTNAALSELLIGGAPGPASAVVVGDLAWDNTGKTLDAAAIEALLSEYDLSRAQFVAAETTSTVARTFTVWSETVASRLLEPEITRSEASELAGRLHAGSKTVLVAGAAGDGKTGVLHQAVNEIAASWPVLAISLDQIEAFSSTHELGVDRLGLAASPVSALAAVAGEGESLLIVDQLDAVSLVSGRMPTTFDQIAALLREADAFEGMRVVLACRQFDIDNDYRLRALADQDDVEQMTIGPLAAHQVAAAVAEMGLEPTALNERQQVLLRSPLHLVLLSAIADEANALSFQTAKGLMDAFYDRKRRDCRARRSPPPRFGETIGVLIDDMSARQRLFSLAAILDADDLLDDADVLASEQVLIRQDGRVSFFHEAFFDYAFARRWITHEESLVAFLLAGEQELFRRAQVRQVLVHLHAEQPDRFETEVESLLAEQGIRFHVKEVVLALLRALSRPSHREWQVLERQIAAGSEISNRLWFIVRTTPWFDRLDEEGLVATWLGGEDDQLRNRALDIMVSVTKERAARVAELLATVKNEPFYPRAVKGLSFYTDLHDSREMFELVLDAVRHGHFNNNAHDLFMSAHALGAHQPQWACELLSAWLVERPDALALNDDGKVEALDSRDYGAAEIVSAAAANAPADFAATVVPYLLQAMAATSDKSERNPKRDRHFGYRTYNAHDHDFDDALLYGVRDALRAMAVAGEEQLAALLDLLAADTHDGAQWLLYETFSAAGAAHAEQAFELLTQGEHRLYSGYTCSTWWTTRELVVAIAPSLSDEQIEALEAIFMQLRPDWESRPGGYSSFTLLSALPKDRLSEAGRRRLGELERQFDQQQPAPPMGVRIERIGPPIPEQAAQRMNDEQWLRAIAKHAGERTDWNSFTGGAEEMAHVLEQETTTDPARFVALGMQLNTTSHPAYLDAILHGLRQTTEIDPSLVFDFVRHVASLGRPDHDRWLPNALTGRLAEEIPDDVIGLILDRALHSPDPADETWQRDGCGGQRIYGGDPFSHGINSARGAAVLTLGDLLVHDADGHRTALIEPSFEALASDPSVAVRSCVAHLLAAGLRHARPSVMKVFPLLVDAPDELLATRPVEELMIYVGFSDSELIEPVIERMLNSAIDKVREAGGRLAAFAGLEFESGLLSDAVLSEDPNIRKGAATICAHRLPITADATAASDAFEQFIDDPDDEVRDAAAEMAGALRNRPLGPHQTLIHGLLASRAFPDALPQLLITLEQSTERVDELLLATTRRFIDVFGGELSSISSRASADARHVGELILRAYNQAPDSKSRAATLDLIDELLAHAAYDLARLVGEAER
jgi:hypothetical protein